jgi:hypothetical protein
MNNYPSISTGQGNQFVSLLPSAPEPLKSPRDNKIREVLKRYAHTWEYSYTKYLCCDSAFAHKKELYIFKFPERFLEIS